MKLSEQTVKQIKQMHSEGWSSRKIGEVLGIGKTTVNNYIAANRNSNSKNPKILFFDLESSPSIVATFGRWKVNIGPESVVREGGIILSACWKFAGEPMQHAVLTPEEAKRDDDLRIVAKLYEAFEQASAVVAHNGSNFDVPLFKTRLIANGFPPPRTVKVVDTLKIAKNLRFNSNKLDSLGNYLQVGRKLSTTGMELWLRCINGDKSALQEMLEYNKQDVILLERVYNKIKAFDSKGLNAGLFHDDDKLHCPVCGSDHVEFTGNEVATSVSTFAEVVCNDCGHRSRTRQPLNSKEQRGKILIG